MLVLGLGLSQLVQFCDAEMRGGDGGDELEVTLIGGGEQYAQSGQRVNGLLPGRPRRRRRTIAMLHLAIVLEKRDLVDGGFDAQNETELSVHFDGERTPLMLDARAEPAFVETLTHLALVIAIQFASEKRGNICGFDRMSKGFQERRLEGLQRLSVLENQVRRVLRLHDTPVIGEVQFCDHRAILVSELVQARVQDFHLELVGQLISGDIIGDLEKGIIQHFIGNAAFLQFVGQPVVSIAVELQPKWTPGRNPQIAPSQLFVDEVEIVGPTFAAVRFQIRFAGYFVMPRAIRRTGFLDSKACPELVEGICTRPGCSPRSFKIF